MMINQSKIYLSEEDLPKYWYNIIPSLPEKLFPPIDSETKKPVKTEKLLNIVPKELINQELILGKYKSEEFIPIPDEILNLYKIFRPTPLVRAFRLEKFLKTPAKIFYKREDVSPIGSHKLNTAFAQAYYAKKEGAETLITDTGAGQWGSAVALASKFFGLKSIVYMVRQSYEDKPYRVTMMRLFGAEVIPSPSNKTKAGKIALKNKENISGSLGIGMSEAVETVMKDKNARLSLGCMSNYAVLHQTIIGMEVKKQLETIGITPDIMIGCVGGGSNFAGFIYPFVKDKINKKIKTEFLAVESKAVPTFGKGEYKYDFQDFLEYLPMIKMYTLGHKFVPPKIHAGGLRYHGKTPTLSLLVNRGIVKTKSYDQKEVLEAGKLFAETEGIIPAPESSHAIKAVLDEAIKCKKTNQEKTIIFNLSGHGLLDLKAYQCLLDGLL
ncbi:TrpB-like pyridoxal-phosphate dependent enzyme [Candidatus Uhrbacteria bacterium RIFCSPLOWO2_02_FULL_51_9]|uniref:Tryptophan synthase beta chain n=1 Tax=Candidatus Uhrbacteria bacterium RIFCSPLOWO2_02_FULL_51_9 TaxID=1802410 RepID=A0A1F7VDD1_9BACT|nr:MAG: TrpB-like pyridoxal-phosphate dependent enzyme [Candidatus Uhrbacteria bacterium RIFCSPLOWO2_02_FULL_51_9]